MDQTLMYLAYQVADYMYYEPDHESKFADGCKTEGGLGYVNTLIAGLLKSYDEKHSEREAILIDHILTMMSSAYLYADLVDNYHATMMCIEISEVIREYTTCVYGSTFYKEVAKDLIEKLSSAKFGLMKAFQGEMKPEIKPIAYTLSIRISLRKVYDEIEQFAESILRK